MSCNWRLAWCLALGVLFVTALAEEEHHHQEAEEVPSGESVAIAVTLLGAISFLMSLFYLTNHSDPDMRRYTYEVISATISIFCAVLLFQSGNDLLEAWLLSGVSEWKRLGINFCIFLFWHLVLQLTLAVTSGALGEIVGMPVDPNMEEIEANMKCYAVLLAHLTGFASINFWAGLQQAACFRSSPNTVLLTICISVPVQLLFARMAKAVRRAVALADDGEVDIHEEMWEEETAESENDVMGLSVSFQAVQALRFLIGGTLPNAEGEEEWETLTGHTGNQALMLLFMGGIFVAGIFFMIMRFPGSSSRTFGLTVTTLSMCFAWCVFFSFDWYIGGMRVVGADPMFLSILLATVLSAVSFATIRVLDKVVDAEWTDDRVDEAVKQVIAAIGILVGFAWEQCFDHATMSLSMVLPRRHLSKLLLGIFCAVILVPAWRFYILPMVIADGWLFGFVMHTDEARWKEVIQHDRFDNVLQKLKRQSVHRGPTLGKVELLHAVRRASTDTPRQSSRRGTRRPSRRLVKDRQLSENLLPPTGDTGHRLELALPAGEEQRARSRHASNGDALDAELERLRRRNTWLEAELKRVSADYLSYVEVMCERFGRIDDTLERLGNARLPGVTPDQTPRTE